jgi:hypothetical protein
LTPPTCKKTGPCWRRCEHRAANAPRLTGPLTPGAGQDGRRASAASPDAKGEAVLAMCSQYAEHRLPAGTPAPAPRRAPRAHPHPVAVGGQGIAAAAHPAPRARSRSGVYPRQRRDSPGQLTSCKSHLRHCKSKL